MDLGNQDILFTRQKHEADRAGTHWDYRIVIGDKAYSWASKKDIPEKGKSIILHEQPVHTASYALSDKIEIPKGQYGAGTTTLDWVVKGKVESRNGHHVINTSKGDRFFLKKMDQYGPKQWLFVRLPDLEKKAEMANKYLEKIAELKEDLTGIPRKKVKWKDRLKNLIRRRTDENYIEKKAAEEAKKPTPLKPHAKRALAKLDKENGVLVDHSMGSGKTLLFLKAVEREQSRNKKKSDRQLILAPASLVTNVQKEIDKHGLKIDMSRLDVMSYEKAVKEADTLSKNTYSLAAADEGQKLRNTGTQRHGVLSDILKNANKRLIASGTPSYNHASDIAPLINIVAGRKVLPEGKKEFEKEFVNVGTEPVPILKRIMGGEPREKLTLKNTDKLGKILNKYVDYYDLQKDPEAVKHFPKKNDSIVQVEMSPEQMGVYKYYEDSLPWHLRLKVRANLPMNKQDAAALNIYSQAIRQSSNSIKPFMPNYEHTSSKVRAAVDSLEKRYKGNKNYRGIVYSNYMNAGVKEYSDELKKRGIEHAIYHGGLTSAQKDAIVEKYNKDKRGVMIITSSGAEGLNTLGTRHVQVLEPHYNKSKIDQIVARATRYKSHDHLPEKDRNVDVEHFQSVFPKSRFGKKEHAIDEYLHHNSMAKDELSQQLRELIKNK